MSIIVQHVSRRFREFEALRDVSLSINDGELIALLGPSGSGKTTLLRIIAGLEPPDKGSVAVSTNDAKKTGRAVGFVFQHYALFKHMSVFENVAFGLRMRRDNPLTETQIRRKVMKLLSLVHLDNMHRRYPSQLSGGQRQRVALARALAVEPKVLLLDEPFGALDAKVRKELRRWLRRLHEELGITTIFVTHDQEEAMEMADRVVVLNAGRIEQLGTPEEVYLKPANAFVYDFLGHYNEFDAWQMADGTLLLKDSEKAAPMGGGEERTGQWFTRLPLIGKLLSGGVTRPRLVPGRRESEQQTHIGTPVKVFCRPHELKVHASKQPGTVLAWLTHVNPAGPLVKLELEREGGGLLDAELPRTEFDGLKLKRGQKLYVRPGQMKVFA